MKYGWKDKHRGRQGDLIQESVEIQANLSPYPRPLLFPAQSLLTSPLPFEVFLKETFHAGIDLINSQPYEWMEALKHLKKKQTTKPRVFCIIKKDSVEANCISEF